MKPYEYVENSLSDINLLSDSLLYETTDGEYTLVFYYNQSRKVCCAVLKDKVFGYETVRISGVLDPAKASRLSDSQYSNTDSFLGSNLNTAANRQENAWIYWGVVFNDLYHSVSEQIYLDDMKCNVRTADNDLSIHAFWKIDNQRDGFSPKCVS